MRPRSRAWCALAGVAAAAASILALLQASERAALPEDTGPMRARHAAGEAPGDLPLLATSGAAPQRLALDPIAEGAGDVAGTDRMPQLVVRGRVLDPEGAGVPDVRVWLAMGRASQPVGEGLGYFGGATLRDEDLSLASCPSAVSDAQGKYVLTVPDPTALPDEPTTRLAILARPGWTTTTLRLDDPQDGAVVVPDLLVAPEMSVVGRAVDDAGQPLADVKIRVRSNCPRPWPDHDSLQPQMPELVPDLLTTSSGADGSFTLRGLWPGVFALELRADGRVRREVSQTKAAPAGDLLLGDVVVPLGGAIEGRVLDPDGRPVEGAEVLCSDREIRWAPCGCSAKAYGDDDDTIHDELRQLRQSAEREPVRTDASGAFRLAGLDAATWDLYAAAPGLEPVRLRNLSAGATGVALRLLPEARLRVRCVDAVSGEPLPAAKVTAQRVSGLQLSASDIELPMLSGAEAAAVDGGDFPPGCWLVRGVGSRATQLSVEAPGYARLVEEAAGVPVGGRGAHVLHLQRESVIAGRVRDTAGAPVAHASIVDDRSRLGQVPLGECDEQGAFRIAGLAAGSYTLRARVEGRPATPERVVHLALGEACPDVELVAVRPGRISGTVVDATGQPLAERTVRAEAPPADGARWPVTADDFTDESGHYSIEGLGPAVYHVSLWGGAAGTQVITLEEGGAAVVDFRAAPPAHLRGRITLGGKPLDGARVEAERQPESDDDPGDWIEPVQTDARGEYELELALAGTYFIETDADGVVDSEPRSITVAVGGSGTVDIDLPAGRLAGRIVSDVDGSPLVGADIELLDDESETLGWTTSDDQGHFELRGVPAGAYTVSFNGWIESAEGFGASRHGMPVDVPVELTDGASRDDLLLSACLGSTLTGRVTLPGGVLAKDGASVGVVCVEAGAMASSGATTAYTFEDGGMRRETCEETMLDAPVDHGSYTLDGLQPGTYRVLALPSQEGLDEQAVLARGINVTLREHGRATLDLVIAP